MKKMHFRASSKEFACVALFISTVVMMLLVYFLAADNVSLHKKMRRIMDENEIVCAHLACLEDTKFSGETYEDESIGKYIEMLGACVRYINMLEHDISERDEDYMFDVASETDEQIDYYERVVNPLSSGNCPAYDDYWGNYEAVIDSLASCD